MLESRKSGVFLHITSLPSEFGIGDLGPSAYKFANILAKLNQSFWQILPINPTSNFKKNSPYAATSAFAGNTLLISPKLLYEDGLLKKKELMNLKEAFLSDKYNNFVDYEKVFQKKNKIFEVAYKNFQSNDSSKHKEDFLSFCSKNDDKWLNCYSIFKVIKDKLNNKSWSDWPDYLKNDANSLIRNFKNKIKWDKENIVLDYKIYEEIEKEKFLQYLFFKQWFNLKKYCNSLELKIIGDMPIYVDFESCDVWQNPDVFKLDSKKKPKYISGVPPDYFSKTGQLWGNPVYNWEYLKDTKYEWWINRISYNLDLFDFLRIDHFRGFVAYWEVKAGEETAKKGKWVKAYPEDFFQVLKDRLKDKFNRLPIIAENLGYITPDVEELIRVNNFTGMKVILFAFGKDFPKSTNLPHNYDRNCVVYTGTHDNNTIVGWFLKEARNYEKKNLAKYLGKELALDTINLDLMKLAASSVANLVIVPVQDILGLDEKARMNHPATTKGNWKWRMKKKEMSCKNFSYIKKLTEIYSRI